VAFSPDNHFLAVSDAGLDRIVVYRFDPEAGSLTPADPPFFAVHAGSGVGHLAFHPNGRFLYAVNNIRQGVTAYRFDPANGSIEDLQTLAPQTATGRTSAAEIAVNAAGTMVYASNGAANSMALLVVDPVRFTLSVLEFTPLIGQRPSSFAFDAAGAYMIVANQESNNITVYTVHPHSGQLRPVGRPTPPIQSPACVVIVPVQ
jgi:6-phosphogluconolactonase